MILLVAGQFALHAAPPEGYYATAEGKAGAELRTALHAIIRNHNALPYSSSSRTDTRDALRVLDRDPADTNNVLLIYSNDSVPASTFGFPTGWNREHQWPDSYGLDGVEPAYSDLRNLRACDANVNSSRGNKFYDISDTNGASYKMPAHPEAPLCSTDSDSWEPPAYEKGDIARAMFYMATRYTGDATNEPALILTDVTALIASTNAYMGRLSTLLKWHAADPVDSAEGQRNDLIYSLYQANRNPFVDHPEWVSLTFAPGCTNRPVLDIAPASDGMVLSWPATNQSTHLQYSTNPASGWTDALVTPTLTNGRFHVLWTNVSGDDFFRLRVLQ